MWLSIFSANVRRRLSLSRNDVFHLRHHCNAILGLVFFSGGVAPIWLALLYSKMDDEVSRNICSRLREHLDMLRKFKPNQVHNLANNCCVIQFDSAIVNVLPG